MDRICQHCGESIVGNAYRIVSEEKGITLLDMVVCALCFMEAKRLRLHTEEIILSRKQHFRSEEPKAACQRKPTAPLALSSTERLH